jgi:hypothetical protein
MTTGVHSPNVLVIYRDIETELLLELGGNDGGFAGRVPVASIKVAPLCFTNSIAVFGDKGQHFLFLGKVATTDTQALLEQIPRCVVSPECTFAGVHCNATVWGGLLVVSMCAVKGLGNLYAELTAHRRGQQSDTTAQADAAGHQNGQGVLESIPLTSCRPVDSRPGYPDCGGNYRQGTEGTPLLHWGGER